MGFWGYIRQDWAFNRENSKGKVIAVLFRTAGLVASNRVSKILLFPYLLFYRLFVEWVLGIELPWGTTVGAGLQVFHGQATVVHKNVKIGRNCIIRQSTTIGNSKPGGRCPVIGNNVNIGSNVCIIGGIEIGDNVTIGAGTVVVKDIPANSVVVGNPGRIITVVPAGPL